tara:strand:+ start:1720 stop:2469 length:750 start_codon:yes stop_codon:yes gene_type:complete
MKENIINNKYLFIGGEPVSLEHVDNKSYMKSDLVPEPFQRAIKQLSKVTLKQLEDIIIEIISEFIKTGGQFSQGLVKNVSELIRSMAPSGGKNNETLADTVDSVAQNLNTLQKSGKLDTFIKNAKNVIEKITRELGPSLTNFLKVAKNLLPELATMSMTVGAHTTAAITSPLPVLGTFMPAAQAGTAAAKVGFTIFEKGLNALDEMIKKDLGIKEHLQKPNSTSGNSIGGGVSKKKKLRYKKKNKTRKW